MIRSAATSADRFVTPGVTVACLGAIAGGVIKSIASQDLPGPSLAALVALAALYALLGTAGMYLVERRGTTTHVLLLLAAMFVAGEAAFVVSRGEAFLLLMPLVTY